MYSESLNKIHARVSLLDKINWIITVVGSNIFPQFMLPIHSFYFVPLVTHSTSQWNLLHISQLNQLIYYKLFISKFLSFFSALQTWSEWIPSKCKLRVGVSCSGVVTKSFASHTLVLFYSPILLIRNICLFICFIFFFLPSVNICQWIQNLGTGTKVGELFISPLKYQIYTRKYGLPYISMQISPCQEVLRFNFDISYEIKVMKYWILLFMWRTPKINHIIICKAISKC